MNIEKSYGLSKKMGKYSFTINMWINSMMYGGDFGYYRRKNK
jgi:hypothetical protein